MTHAGAEAAQAAVPRPRESEERHPPRVPAALLEQAKGALVLHYRIGAPTALRVLETWAEAAGTTLSAVVDALLHQVARDQEPLRGSLGAWLVEQLGRPSPVRDEDWPDRAEVAQEVVTVDSSYTALDDVVAAARRAAARGVPLELTFPETGHGPARAQLLQRVDLAVELARAVEPGLDVRLPTERRSD
jgi:hypothetical protein